MRLVLVGCMNMRWSIAPAVWIYRNSKSLRIGISSLELQSVAGVSEVATVGGMEQTYPDGADPTKWRSINDIATIKQIH